MSWVYEGPPPREHARRICELKTLAARREYLEKNVPERFRDWVKILVRIAWEMRRERNAG